MVKLIGYIIIIKEVSKAEGRVGQTTNMVIGGTVSDDSTNEWLTLDQKVLFLFIFVHYLNLCLLLIFNFFFCLQFCDAFDFCVLLAQCLCVVMCAA